MIGTAHVALLEPRSSDRISRILGREFGVFNRGVRTYNPGFRADFDQPMQHPVASPMTIQNWDGIGPDEFEAFLVSRLLQRSTGREFDHDVPSYSHIHELALKEKRAQAQARGASDAELLELALTEIENLKGKLFEEAATYGGLIKAAESERDQAVEALDQQEAETSGLRARVEHLLGALECKGTDEVVSTPDTFEGLEDWCRTYLSGDIVIHQRAFRAAKKSDFSEPSFAYKALLLLRDVYVPMHVKGGDSLRKDWYDGLAKLNLDERPSFSGDRAGEEGDEYRIPWGKRNRFLDMHLKGNNSRDDRYCFRLYYFWDEEKKQVVVGSFPGHLANRVT